MKLNDHHRPLITLSSDFGWSSRGIGVMEVVARNICPEADVVHLSHEIPSFSIVAGARELEAVKYLPVGFHVCVVDPGVGTKRDVVALETDRGDILVGPDNGVLRPATQLLNGITRAFKVTNKDFALEPLSTTFHGRDIMVPAAAALAQGTSIDELGEEIAPDVLEVAPYREAEWEKDGSVKATVISINKFGNVFLNILISDWLANSKDARACNVSSESKEARVPIVETFGEVKEGKTLFYPDDYGRMALAVNMGSFQRELGLMVGSEVTVSPAPDAPFHIKLPGKS